MEIIFGILESIIGVFNYVWWLILPLFLFPVFWNLRMRYIRTRYVKDIDWLMLEIKIPKDILKTPKAMEQVFSEMAATYSFGMKPIDIYLNGKVEPWISFEMVGHAGGVNFYIHTPSKYRNLIESAIYAQYPEAEIRQAEDYAELFGNILPNKIYDVFGAEFGLLKESYYPIKTYQYFEEPTEERRLDPIAAISEVMSNLKEGEAIWLQTLISPTGAPSGNDWQAEGVEKINEITGKKTEKEKKKGLGGALYEWLRNLFFAPVKYPDWPVLTKKEEAAALKFLNPHEQEIVKAISNKISKFGFEAVIRFVYIDRRDSFSPLNPIAVIGSFQQFGISHLNAFKPKVAAKGGWLAHFFPKYKELAEFSLKKEIFQKYRERRFGNYNKTRAEKFSVLNTEELATVYHFPAIMVKAPRLRKVEAKKAGPPAGLPIE
jgi:hypothetical protein